MDIVRSLAAASLKNQADLPPPWHRGQLLSKLAWRILVYRWPLRLGIAFLAILSALFGLASPFFQKTFIDSLLTLPSELAAREGYRLAGLMVLVFVAMMLSQLCTVALRYYCAREGSLVQGHLSEALYTHTLQLSSKVRAGMSTGEMTNAYIQDVQASVVLLEDFLPNLLTSLVPFIIAPLAISLYFKLPMSHAGLALALSCLVLFLFSYKQSRFFGAFKRLAAQRLAIVNEWIQNIRIIRILGWMQDFESRILTMREKETINRIGMVTNGSTMNSLAQVLPLLINVVGIVGLIQARHGHLSPGEIFGLTWVFAVFLSRPLRMLPWTLIVFVDGISSCRRLEAFFALEAEPEHKAARVMTATEGAPAIEVTGLTLRYGDHLVLDAIALTVQVGEFVVITGEVAAGKTQLLLSLLRETPAAFTSFRIHGSDVLEVDPATLRAQFALVPQDGFVMSASLRDNVAFEYDTPPSVDAVLLPLLTAAQFKTDLDSFPGGLGTEIGERGVNLSGGQKQRVNLARAAYADRGIILLDDTLSAVDVETEELLIKDLICGIWAGKTRILVTHRLSVLAHANRVFNLEQGVLKEQRGQPCLS